MGINYQDIAGTYDNWRSYSPDVVRTLCRLGNLRDGARVLDIGCGTGSLGSQIHEYAGATVTGIDRSLQMLAGAGGRYVRPLCGDLDGTSLPFKDDVFDAIIGTYVIHHVRHLGPLFSECFRVLRAGMILLLTSSHEQIECYHPVLKKFFPGFVELEKNRFPDICAVTSLLDRAGFRHVEFHDVFLEKIVLDRAYLEKVEGKFVSTYHLLPKEEFDRGARMLRRYIEESGAPVCQEWRGTLIAGKKYTRPVKSY
ncbi:MAG TPA: methyltransferase domain-containing protein [Spirochaetota bacterium]|nr:methyltransferase domain-containing protein [Spirochaetota bacterium]HPC40558.1 methyltransferase domain-containing protein [Spirochaetota bacterium]HPL18383.1 methyltransferase domain-containing protein [Spirochaetota bacterium]HQF07934.1 methyltransferase domain-containing protein [Spirochaetota bacterium]HQH96494.1 methyltransferase domain-containing protein [Spirochaetota bacterium]